MIKDSTRHVWFAADSQTAGIKMPSPLYIILARRNFAQVFIVQSYSRKCKITAICNPRRKNAKDLYMLMLL